MIGAVILAAGESRRMGTQKLLLPFDGTTVIAHIVEQVRASRIDRIVVVTGHDRTGVTAALEGCGVTFAHNANYTGGMLTSVRCGLAALPTETSAFVVVLGDQPGVTPAVIDALIDAFEKRTHDIVVPMYDNGSGHPIVIAARYREAIMTQFDTTGLRGLVRGRPESVLRLTVSNDGVLHDMDTPEDYERELRRARQAEQVKTYRLGVDK